MVYPLFVLGLVLVIVGLLGVIDTGLETLARRISIGLMITGFAVCITLWVPVFGAPLPN